jgi:hypothetical protein
MKFNRIMARWYLLVVENAAPRIRNFITFIIILLIVWYNVLWKQQRIESKCILNFTIKLLYRSGSIWLKRIWYVHLKSNEQVQNDFNDFHGLKWIT